MSESQISQQKPEMPELIYPEIRLKIMRARFSLILFIFSGVIFGSMPFYRPDQPSDHQFHPFAMLVWLLPLAFLVIFIKAQMSVKFLRKRTNQVKSAEVKDLEVEIYLSNFNVRRGRGFAYRVVFQGQPPKEGVVESSEFVANIGYSEKGGDVIDAEVGKKVFAHKLTVKPLYRRMKTRVKAYFRPGSANPFLLISDGLRIWLKDEP